MTARPRLSFPTVQEHVIDPRSSARPLPTATWQAKQTDPATMLVGTDASVYCRRKDGTSVMYDPGHSDTNATLGDYRLALQLRAPQDGPPPYTTCP